jgi:hypothetical protein
LVSIGVPIIVWGEPIIGLVSIGVPIIVCGEPIIGLASIIGCGKGIISFNDIGAGVSTGGIIVVFSCEIGADLTIEFGSETGGGFVISRVDDPY